MKEKWRYRCPNHHSRWQKRVNTNLQNSPQATYYCETCRENGDNPHFETLVDMKQTKGVV